MTRTATTALIMVFWAASTVAYALTPRQYSFNELNVKWGDVLRNTQDQQVATIFKYDTCFRKTAQEYGLPVPLLFAVARGESDFNPKAKSSANAIGLMQILWPGTANHLGIYNKSDLYDPCINIAAGGRYLKQLLTRYKGNLHLTLAAYNYGPGRIKVDAKDIPNGASWYSAYIYDHYRYVIGLGNDGKRVVLPEQYTSERKLVLVSFSKPWRTKLFVDNIRDLAPTVRLDWFDSGIGLFRVVVLHRSRAELEESKLALRRAGFWIE